MAEPYSSIVEFLQAFLVLFAISACFIYTRRRCRGGGSRKNTPPGPPQLPVVGNMFQVGGIFHRTAAKLAQTYGPIMTIKILSKTMVMVSSPKVAKQMFQKYDQTFTGRLVLDAWRAFDHHNHSLIILPLDKEWRKLHKVLKEHILSNERLNASQGLRHEKVQQLCDYIQTRCGSGANNGEAVDIGAVAFTTVLNFLSTTLFSVDFADYYSNTSNEIQDALQTLQELIGKPNVADLFPVLRPIDPQGIRRQMNFCFGILLQRFDGIINERLKESEYSSSSSSSSFATSASSSASKKSTDLLSVFLDKCHKGEADLSYNDIKHLILDLFIAGTHSSSITIEWVMAELLRHPEKMEKVVQEIRQVIGEGDIIQESDMSKLPYLQAVVKETLRLHPAVSLTGRQPSDDLEIDGYVVPKDAEIFLNLWAINRDPTSWNDPDSFVPERFLDRKIEMTKGQHFEFLPFGAGRRACPGLSLSLRMVHLMSASLLHRFDWKLADGMNSEDLDMSDKNGFIAQKAFPLRVVPTKATIL